MNDQCTTRSILLAFVHLVYTVQTVLGLRANGDRKYFFGVNRPTC